LLHARYCVLVLVLWWHSPQVDLGTSNQLSIQH
jgi:hypothetical protein